MKREFPDGRDLNRVFPGSKNGSLASRVAYRLLKKLLKKSIWLLIFTLEVLDRFNAPQIRIAKNNPKLDELAKTFGAPFVLYSKNIKKIF